MKEQAETLRPSAEALRHLKEGNTRFVSPAIEALRRSATIDEIARMNALELKRKSSIIRKAAEKGDLRIVSTFYHLDGKVDFDTCS